MGRYVVVPIERDAIDAEDTIFSVLREQWPGWQESDGDPLTLLGRGAALLYTEVAELSTRMGEEAFRYYGRSLADVAPIEDTPARGSVTFTATDANGPYEVPEGTELAGRVPGGGQPLGFATTAPLVIPNGATTGIVAVEALVDGTVGNGITGTGELSDYFDYLAGVEFNGSTGNGTDAESDPDYLDRLHETETLSTDTPILPADFATLARTRFGAYRATAIQGLDPAANGGAGTLGNTRYVTVIGVDEAGEPLPGATKTAISDGLEAMRESGFVVPVIDPTYTLIDVAFTATAWPGWDPTDVQDAVVARLLEFLAPARWGAKEDTGELREWINDTTVRVYDVVEQIKRVEGVHYVNPGSVQIAKSGDALGAGDVVMTGWAPLPRPGNIAGTVLAA